MSEQKQTAGAFDVRNVIAALIGAYGLVLVLMGLSANLWSGLAMVAFAVAFAVWARLRPVVVDPPTTDGDS